MDIELSGRRALVTGGTKGIGRAIALWLRRAGASVEVCARNDPGDLPDGIGFHAVDLREADQISTVVDAAAERLGGLDILINNAGGSPPAETATASPRFSERIVALNLLAPIWCSQAAHRYLLHAGTDRSEASAIVNISSVAALRPGPTVAAYAAAKAGLMNFSGTIAQEWAPHIRVNTVTVGLVRTSQSDTHYGDDGSVERIASTIPIGRFIEPDDVAAACGFLVSPLTGAITGANLVIDGGGDRPRFLDAADGI